MFCPKCGAEMRDAASFCPACGERVGKAPNSNTTVATPVPGNNINQNQNNSAPKKNTTVTVLLIVISALLTILLIVAGCFFFLGGDEQPASVEDAGQQGQVSSEQATAPVTPAPPQTPDVVSIVNSLIESRGLSANVGVAVKNNITGEKYICNGANQRYTSWGFYLPVYMAFCDTYPNDFSSYKNNIMSSDPGKCNSAANFAIDAMGGISGVNSILSNNYGLSSTTLGRLYGQTNTYSDNYTSASEAVDLVYNLNQRGMYSQFCYNLSSFGLTAPAGATVYSQLGSENRNVKNYLNVFAIVKSANADYSVVILTQNKASAGGFVDEILNAVHACMEG